MQTSVLPVLTAAAATAGPVSKQLRMQVPVALLALSTIILPLGSDCLLLPGEEVPAFFTHCIKHVLLLRHWKVSQMLSLSAFLSEGTENRRI